MRRPDALQSGKRSRGEVVVTAVRDASPAPLVAENLATRRNDYAPFNLIYGRPAALHYLSSDSWRPQPLAAGLHGLSNAGLDTPWPKLEYAKARFAEVLRAEGRLTDDALFAAVTRTRAFPDAQLPATGIPLAWERTLSPPFILSGEYGTRSSLLLTVDRQGAVTVSERTYGAGEGPSRYMQRTFTLPP